MGQAEILGFLNAHSNRDFCSREIAQALGVNKYSVNQALRRLLKAREVSCEVRQVGGLARSGFAWVKFYKALDRG